MNILDLYYFVRPVIPRPLQIGLRRIVAMRQLRRSAGVWPILESAGAPPEGWKGWPDGKRFALVLTHDVEAQAGHDKCRQLMDLEESLGFRSSFNIVPGQYKVSPDLRHEMVSRGFEVGVHGLRHDGRLFRSRRDFEASKPQINGYLKDWSAVGFRAPSMLRNLKWIGEFDIEYDSSTFDTDPFEPQSEGAGTIFPFIVNSQPNRKPYVELPYTLPQDSTLFIILGETSSRIWKEKLNWIAERGGMALVNTHPDYMRFDDASKDGSTYPVGHYREFLEYVNIRHRDQFWHTSARGIARWVSATPGMVKSKTLRRSCMVAYSFYDSDNRVRRYAETLARRGDDVEAIGLRQSGDPLTGVLNGVNVSRIQSRRRDERGKLVYLARILRFWIKSSAILAWRHWRAPYSLIHVHSVPDFEVFAAWLPKLLGAKVILDIHDIVPEFYASKFGVDQKSLVYRALRRVERSSCRFAHHVIAANHLWYELLKQRAVPADKCSVFLNHVDWRIFYPRQRTRHDDRFVIVYPGGLQWHQGLDIAIRAMVAVRKEVPNAELHIYGGGDQEGALRSLVRELSIAEVVRFGGSVSLGTIPDILVNADLGIVPKRAEGFGNEAYSTKILEYMTQSLPVVVSNTMIDSFYFNHSIVRFFNSGDDGNLAEGIIALANDPTLRRKLSENAFAYVETQSWARREHEYLAIVDRLVAESGSRS